MGWFGGDAEVVHKPQTGQRLSANMHGIRLCVLYCAHSLEHLLFHAQASQRSSFRLRLLPMLCCAFGSSTAVLSLNAVICNSMSVNT